MERHERGGTDRPGGRRGWLGFLVGGAVLALMVADGVRNRASEDVAVMSPEDAGQTEIPASFPRTDAPAATLERSAECAARAGGPAVGGGEPIGDQGRWLSSIDYPLASLRAGHEGVSALVLRIDRTGRIAGCDLAASSGDPLLDTAACETLRRRARYQPARDAAGCPVPTVKRQRVRWQIPTG